MRDMEKQGYIFSDGYRKLSNITCIIMYAMLAAAIIACIVSAEYVLTFFLMCLTALLIPCVATRNRWMARYELTEESVSYLYGRTL